MTSPITWPLTGPLTKPITATFGTVGGQGFGPVVDPLPMGSPVFFYGDSIFQLNFGAGANLAQKQTGLVMRTELGGEITHALMYDPRLTCVAYNDLTKTDKHSTNDPPYYAGSNRARSAASFSDMISTDIPQATAYHGVCMVLLCIGTNSLNDAAAASKLVTIFAMLRAKHRRAIIGVRNVSAVSFAAHVGLARTAAQIDAMNAIIAAAVDPANHIHLIDVAAGYANDGGNPGYGLDINYQVSPYQASPGGDGLHPGPDGALLLGAPPILAFIQAHAESGNAIRARKIASILPAGYGTLTGSTAISSTAGTGGGVISGFVPTNVTVAHGSAANVSDCVCSLEANPESGGQKLVLTITAKGVATLEQFVIRPSSIAIAAAALQNQWARLWAKLEIDQGPGWLNATLTEAERSNNAGNFSLGQYGIYPDGVGLTRTLWPSTPHLNHPASGTPGTQPSITVKVNASVGGTHVVKLWEWDVQTENDPRLVA